MDNWVPFCLTSHLRQPHGSSTTSAVNNAGASRSRIFLSKILERGNVCFALVIIDLEGEKNEELLSSSLFGEINKLIGSSFLPSRLHLKVGRCRPPRMLQVTLHVEKWLSSKHFTVSLTWTPSGGSLYLNIKTHIRTHTNTYLVTHRLVCLCWLIYARKFLVYWVCAHTEHKDLRRPTHSLFGAHAGHKGGRQLAMVLASILRANICNHQIEGAHYTEDAIIKIQQEVCSSIFINKKSNF